MISHISLFRTNYHRHILTVFLLMVISSCQSDTKTVNGDPGSQQMTAGEWRFAGHLGQYIDKIADERILKQESWDLIYPETEEAFRIREDDAAYPENGKWRGEFWGKYMLSVIAACNYYHSDELKTRIAEAVRGLISTQDDNGYIGTYKHSDFVIGNNWNVWGRKYTLWGLVEAWDLLQDKSILDAAKSFADQLISEVGPGAEDIVKTGNFYGMPSSSILLPIVKLYVATGEKKYLEYAEYIVLQWTKHPEGLPDILNKGLTGEPVHTWFPQKDPHAWAKGYELTSCVEGLVELYKVTGEKQLFEAAEKIHAALVEWERTPIGSVSFNDKYVGSAGIINTLSEVCDAVYWNRLSFQLFQLTGEEKYVDEIERTLFNSLLCSFNQDGSWGLRRIRMSHCHVPATNHFLQNHQCCTDNLPRGLFQSADLVLSSKGNNIYLSLFNEGEGRAFLPKGKEVHVKLEGDFLTKEGISLVVEPGEPQTFGFAIRMPEWSSKTIVKVNGTEYTGAISDNWMMIERTWQDGDTIDIRFDLKVWWATFDTKKLKDDSHGTDFNNKIWAGARFMLGSNLEINERYDHVKSLSVNDALPDKPAVTFFYGPLALSRDIRITGDDIFEPVQFSESSDSVLIQSVEAPEGIWKAFELNPGHGQKIKFCDFSSAGNTWDESSEFNTWCLLKE